MPGGPILIVLCGAALLGAIGGAVGSFALLRRQSLLGDALAHASLPGVCLAWLVTGGRSPLALLAGALAAGLIGAALIVTVVRLSRIKEDSAIGIVLSVFFGTGIVLLTHIQRLPGANKAGLDRFLFGQAAALRREDLLLIGVVCLLALAAMILLYRPLKVLAFDRAFGRAAGLPMLLAELTFTALLVVVVVIGLQLVGVILAIATLVTPAAAARQWTDRLGTMLLLSALLGAGCGLVGGWVSATAQRVPTGPAIVLLASVLLIVSLLAAPRRGVIWSRLAETRLARRIRRENLLKDLYRSAEDGAGFEAWVAAPALMGVRGRSARELRRTARRLLRGGWVEGAADGGLRLTESGRRSAGAVVRRHRLWELYLTRRLELPADHVHRDAEAMEHVLTDRTVARIDELLGRPRTDPHGRRIPAPEEVT